MNDMKWVKLGVLLSVACFSGVTFSMNQEGKQESEARKAFNKAVKTEGDRFVEIAEFYRNDFEQKVKNASDPRNDGKLTRFLRKLGLMSDAWYTSYASKSEKERGEYKEKPGSFIERLQQREHRADVGRAVAGWTTVGIGALALGVLSYDIIKKRLPWRFGLCCGAAVMSAGLTWRVNKQRFTRASENKGITRYKNIEVNNNFIESFKAYEQAVSQVNEKVLCNLDDGKKYCKGDYVQPDPQFNTDKDLSDQVDTIIKHQTALYQIQETPKSLVRVMLGDFDYSQKNNLILLKRLARCDTEKWTESARTQLVCEYNIKNNLN